MVRIVIAASLLVASGAAFADGYHLLSSQGGRFVYGWTGGTAKTAALLDTQTGRMWEPICIVKDIAAARAAIEQSCERTVFKPIYFEHEDGLISHTPDGKKFILKPGDFESPPSKR